MATTISLTAFLVGLAGVVIALWFFLVAFRYKHEHAKDVQSYGMNALASSGAPLSKVLRCPAGKTIASIDRAWVGCATFDPTTGAVGSCDPMDPSGNGNPNVATTVDVSGALDAACKGKGSCTVSLTPGGATTSSTFQWPPPNAPSGCTGNSCTQFQLVGTYDCQ